MLPRDPRNPGQHLDAQEYEKDTEVFYKSFHRTCHFSPIGKLRNSYSFCIWSITRLTGDVRECHHLWSAFTAATLEHGMESASTLDWRMIYEGFGCGLSVTAWHQHILPWQISSHTERLRRQSAVKGIITNLTGNLAQQHLYTPCCFSPPRVTLCWISGLSVILVSGFGYLKSFVMFSFL